METFIDYKGNLFTQYEYARGEMPSPKILKDRRKLADKGSVRVIVNENDFSISEVKPNKIVRKV